MRYSKPPDIATMQMGLCTQSICNQRAHFMRPRFMQMLYVKMKDKQGIRACVTLNELLSGQNQKETFSAHRVIKFQTEFDKTLKARKDKKVPQLIPQPETIKKY